MATNTKRALKNHAVYNVTVEGTYSAQAGDRLSERPYEMTFKMPGGMVTNGPLSMFCKHIAPKFMPVKYPGYIRLITHNVTNAVAEDGAAPTDIRLMNQVDLVNYIEQEELDVQHELYTDPDQLRQAIMDIEADPEGFKKSQGRLVKIKSGVLAIGRELLALQDQSEIVGEAPQTKPSATVKPKGKAKVGATASPGEDFI